MLKLTYAEDCFNLEYIEESVENWLLSRVTLALRSATSIHIQPTTATFPILANSQLIPELEKISHDNNCGNTCGSSIELSYCDTEMIEVSLKGSWITLDRDSETGIFVTTLEKSSELLLQKMCVSPNLCWV